MTDRATTVAVLVVLATVAGAVPAGVAGASSQAPTGVDVGSASPAVGSGAAASTASLQDCEFPFEYTDATGTTVTISEEPESVVTLAPSAAQTMWEIGGKEKVVGVSQFATYLEGAGEKANVSAPGFGQYNLERMVTLQPDVVLAPNVVPNQSVTQMREAGLTVVKFEAATSIEDVAAKTELIGRITGQCEGAAAANRWMRANLRAIDAAVGDRERPRVLYMLGGGYSVGSGTFIDEMITRAGGQNIVAAAGVSGYPQVSEELVAERDPQYLLSTFPDPPIAEQAPYNSTTAVRENNVVVLNPNYMNQPAPRSVVYAVRNMTEQFHPDAFESVEYVSRSEAATTPTATRTATPTSGPTATTTETGTPTEMGTATSTEMTGPDGEDGTATATETSDGGGQPGFGAGLAAIAVLVAVLALRRRR